MLLHPHLGHKETQSRVTAHLALGWSRAAKGRKQVLLVYFCDAWPLVHHIDLYTLRLDAHSEYHGRLVRSIGIGIDEQSGQDLGETMSIGLHLDRRRGHSNNDLEAFALRQWL
jgi:hypothetical protein